MQRNMEPLVFEAARVIEELEAERERFTNVEVEEVATERRRRLREVLWKAFSEGWNDGYSAAALDAAAGRQARREDAQKTPAAQV